MTSNEISDLEFEKHLDIFEKIRNEYIHSASIRKNYSKALENIKNILEMYLVYLSRLSYEELNIRYKNALKFLDEAHIEYSKFIPSGPIAPGQNPPATPFNELEAAHDKFEIAETWLMGITKAIAGRRDK